MKFRRGAALCEDLSFRGSTNDREGQGGPSSSPALALVEVGVTFFTRPYPPGDTRIHRPGMGVSVLFKGRYARLLAVSYVCHPNINVDRALRSSPCFCMKGL